MQKLYTRLLSLALALTMALGTALPAFAGEAAADTTEETVTAAAEEAPEAATTAEAPETPEEETAAPEEQPESSDTETTVPEEQPESSGEETVTEEAPAEEEVPADGESAGEETEEEAAEAETVSYTMATYGVPGLDRALTAAELAAKQTLVTGGVKESFDDADASEYEAGCVLLYTDSRAYADETAAALDAAVVSCEYGVAMLRLNTLTTAQAMAAAFDGNAAIPALYPNYIYTMGEGASNGGTKQTYGTGVISFNSVDAPSKQTWSDITATWENLDPFLKDPTATDHFTVYSKRGEGFQYMHTMVDTYAAWAVTMGKGVKVGVIDSGVYSGHEDLGGRVVARDVYDQSSETIAEDHGTHVAGIIAATANNGLGGAGIAPEATIYAYPACEKIWYPSLQSYQYVITTWQLYGCLTQAVRDGCDVINMSIGGSYYDHIEEIAVESCIDAGIVVVVSAGNDSGQAWNYPANFADVLSVGAVDPSGQRAPYSTFSNCTLSAPGSYILSTIPNDKYDSYNGTSMAAPVVSGVAALYISYYGGASDRAGVQRIIAALKKSCTQMNGSTAGMGAGIINAGNLFSDVVRVPSVTFNQKNSDGTIPENTGITISATDDNIAMLVFTFDGSNPTVKNGEVTNGVCVEGNTYTFDAGVCLYGSEGGVTVDQAEIKPCGIGTYTLKAMAINSQGKTSKVTTVKFTVDNKQLQTIGLWAGSCDPEAEYATVVPGGTITLYVSTYPDTVAAVDWDISDASWKIRKKSGTVTLTAPKKAAVGDTVSVAATCLGVTATLKVQVVAPATLVELLDEDGSVIASSANKSNKYSFVTDAFNGGQLPYQVRIDGELTDLYNIAVSNAEALYTAESGSVIHCSKKGTATVTVQPADGSAVKCVLKIAVTQKVEALSIAPANSQYSVAAGKSVTVKSTVTPSTAANKALTWSVTWQDEEGEEQDASAYGVTVKNGKVSVSKATTLKGQTVTVTAATTDGSGLFASCELYVSEPAYAYTVVSDDPKFTPAAGKTAASLKLLTRQVELSDYDIEPDENDETRAPLEVKASADNAPDGTWTSSNTKVVRMEGNEAVAVGAGSATLTYISGDGLKKKATVKVTVDTPASYLEVSSDTAWSGIQELDTVAVGCGKTFRAYFGTDYGKPTNQAVTWSIDAVYMYDRCQLAKAVYDDMEDEDYIYEDVTEKLLPFVTVNAKGKVSVSKNARTMVKAALDDNYVLVGRVTATARDGTGVTNSRYFQLSIPATKVITGYIENGAFIKSSTMYANAKVQNDADYLYILSDAQLSLADFVFTSSRPSVGSITDVVPLYQMDKQTGAYIKDSRGNNIPMTYNGYYVYGVVAKGDARGTAKLAVRFCDGSNKTVSMTVKVQ